MRLFLIGCEYTGTTTLAHALHRWAKATIGAELGSIHDHWKIPHTIGHPPNLTDEEQDQILALPSHIIEANQRHNLYYHTPTKPDDGDHIIIGFYIEDTIYSQLYYRYGGAGQAGDRIVHSKRIEHQIMQYTPHLVLILLTASRDAIAHRMRTSPHRHALVQEQDIEKVLGRFEEEYSRSILPHKFTLDTSTATVDETVAEFATKIQPYLTTADRLRMMTR